MLSDNILEPGHKIIESGRGSSDGIGTSAQFSYPRSITRDSSGNIFISESNYGRIRKLIFSLSLPGPLPVCDSTWHHIALTYTGSSTTNILTAYIDGASVVTNSGAKRPGKSRKRKKSSSHKSNLSD